MKTLITAAAFLAAFLWALLSIVGAAAARPACNPRNQVLDQLADRYKEAPVAAGVTNQGALVEVLATGDGKTWTIIVTTPQGQSCIVAAGEGWRQVAPKRDGEGA